MIAIKNSSAEDFKDRFDGNLYAIPVGQIRKVPEAAALCWFGIGGDDHDRFLALRRIGKLATPAWLDKFKAVKIKETIVEEKDANP